MIDPCDPYTLITIRSVDANKPLTKRWTRNADGALGKQDYAKAWDFEFEGKHAPGIRSLYAALGDITSRSDAAQWGVLRGEPQVERGLRRIAAREDGGHIRACPRAWVMLDIDKGLELPLGVDVRTPEGLLAAGEFVRDRLPVVFHDVTCVVQASSSAGVYSDKLDGETIYVDDWTGAWPIKAHVWFVCDRPVSDLEWKTWTVTWAMQPDRSLFDSTQVHYIAPPIFAEGAADPMQSRIVLLEGVRDTVSVPAIRSTPTTTGALAASENSTAMDRAVSKWSATYDWKSRGFAGKPTAGDRFDCPACEGENDAAEVLPDGKVLCRANGHAERAPGVGGQSDNGYVMTLFEAFERISRAEADKRMRAVGYHMWSSTSKIGRGIYARAHAADASSDAPQSDDDSGPPDAADSFELAEIYVTDQRSALCNKALAALARHPAMFTRAGLLVRVAYIDDKLIASAIKPQALVDALSDVARLYVPTREGHRARPLKTEEAESILARTDHEPVRPLKGIVYTPTLLRDGRLVSKPGYDAPSGLFYAPIKDWPQLDDEPTELDARASIGRLIALFGEFAFEHRDHAVAVCVAAMLTMQARHLFDGAAPLFLFDASAPGSGKGLASRVVTRIGAGHEVSADTQRDNAETEKRITSYLLSGRDVMLIDNIQRPLGGAALCSAITESVISGRELGKSRGLELPNKLTFLGNGNNVVLGEDMHRRTLVARNVPRCADPHLRMFTRDLDVYTREHQIQLTSDVITVLRAFLLERPSVELRPFGGFAEWSRIVRGAMVWLGLPDVAPTQGEGPMDFETQQAIALLAGWRDTIGYKQVSAGGALQGLRGSEGAFAALCALTKARVAADLSAQSVGNVLGKFRDRVVRLPDGTQAALESKTVKGSSSWSLNVLSV